jgi:hypothetical protein
LLSQPFAVTSTAAAVANVDAMGLDHVRSEIEHMRAQVGRQRKEILQLQRAGISTASAGLLLQRPLAKMDAFVTSGTGSRRRRAVPEKASVLGGRSW